MKIHIGTYELCAGARDSDEEAETTATQSSRTSAPLRADDARVFKGRARVFSFTFTKTREHANFLEAENFRLLHASEIPNEGVLSFTTEEGNGVEQVKYFTWHNVEQVRTRQIGVGTITTYTILASGPSTSAPA